MKKSFGFWLMVFLVLSLVLPFHSMAQSTLTLTLESYTTGDRISGAPIKSFSMGTDGNLVVYLDGPFTFADLLPPIWVQTTGSCSSSVPTPYPTPYVTSTQGNNITFTVCSSAGATLSMQVSPENGVARFPQSTGSGTFTWDTGGDGLVPTGSYLAVFQAEAVITPGTSSSKSQLVVMIKITPPETVTAPTVSGPAAGTVNQSVPFTATGSTSTASHALEYQFDWGDGATSSWGSSSQSHAYAAIGTYSIKAKARCTPDQVESAWSGTSSITISNVPTFTVTPTIVTPAGGSVSPSSWTGTSGGTATFTVTTNSGYTASVSEGTLSGGAWTISNVTSTHTATLTFTQASSGCPAGSTCQTLTWGMNPINSGRISFTAGETKTFFVNVGSTPVRGFEIIFTPQADFTVTCSFKMPLKPDGTPYRTSVGKTEFTGLWASYDGAIHPRIWSQALGGIVLEPAIYEGNFTLTCTADRVGWGTMTTSLTP